MKARNPLDSIAAKLTSAGEDEAGTTNRHKLKRLGIYYSHGNAHEQHGRRQSTQEKQQCTVTLSKIMSQFGK